MMSNVPSCPPAEIRNVLNVWYAAGMSASAQRESHSRQWKLLSSDVLFLIIYPCTVFAYCLLFLQHRMLHRETGEKSTLNKTPSASAFYMWKKKLYKYVIAEIAVLFNQTSSLRSKKEYYIWYVTYICNIKSHIFLATKKVWQKLRASV